MLLGLQITLLLSGSDQRAGIVAQAFPLLGQPCFGMFEEGGEVESDEEVCGISTGAFSE